MKKYLVTLAVFAAAVLHGFAQTTSVSPALKDGGKFSIGLEGGLPNYQTTVNVIVGFSVKYEAAVGRHTCITISAGYNSFLNGRTAFDLGSIPSAYGYIPLKAGIKYYVTGGLFLEAQPGVTFATKRNIDGDAIYGVYSGGLGYTFGSHIEAGIRYEGWISGETAISQTSLRLAYRF
jgi:hypothetical protein